jgi:biopolymer transport protein TolQ
VVPWHTSALSQQRPPQQLAFGGFVADARLLCPGTATPRQCHACARKFGKCHRHHHAGFTGLAGRPGDSPRFLGGVLGIVIYKWLAFRRIEQQSATFLDVFRRSTKFSEVQAVCKSLEGSPLVGMFQAGYAELNLQLRQPAANSPPAAAARPTLKSLAAVDRALLRASSVEVNKLEKRVPFLATTASITPFIGLFGTVWGIMLSFFNIGAQGSTDLAVVAPGIADALIATAFGLFAAIPAVYFYNHFTTKVKLYASEMDDFSLEFLNIAERNFT